MHYLNLASRGEAATHLSLALERFLSFAGDPVAPVERAIELEPGLAEPRILRAWMLLSAADANFVPLACADIAAAEAASPDARARMHLAALKRWCEGDWRGAARLVEDLNLENPRDILGLLVGHSLDYYVGDVRMQLVRIERALPHWDSARPGWHGVLAMHAFGLEENGRYAEAERAGRMALEAAPHNAWAQHAVAHVMEMQGRREDGIEWMQGNAHWQADSGLAVHNWWHLALFHLGLEDFDGALALYDGPITAGVEPSPLPLHDASSMLWRLRLADRALGDRWSALAERWAPWADEAWSAFNDWHALMAFAGAGRQDLVERKLDAQARADAGSHYAASLQDVGHAVAHAMLAHAQGEHARVVELLRRVRGQTHRFGGSAAQRDLIELTLLDSARRGGYRALAQALELERRCGGPKPP
jgi:tetratricopeptide (TPR) repeat protein